MVLFIQYTLGFLILIYALYNSTLAFAGRGVGDIFYLFVAIGAALASFILLKDLLFAPIVKQVVKLFYPQGFDTGSDFSRIDSLIYKKEFTEAIKLLDEHITEKPDCAKAYLKKCQIQYDHLKDLDATVVTAYERLNSRELTEEDERLIFLVLDILIDCQKLPEAKQVIETVLSKLKHEKLKCRLQSRLESLG
ncbi:MAG: hypothetical protein MK132_18705 [Lentisphaerales bacterium]|nr:hypothetical protein [Lentisphaerales bacterium]